MLKNRIIFHIYHRVVNSLLVRWLLLIVGLFVAGFSSGRFVWVNFGEIQRDSEEVPVAMRNRIDSDVNLPENNPLDPERFIKITNEIERRFFGPKRMVYLLELIDQLELQYLESAIWLSLESGKLEVARLVYENYLERAGEGDVEKLRAEFIQYVSKKANGEKMLRKLGISAISDEKLDQLKRNISFQLDSKNNTYDPNVFRLLSEIAANDVSWVIREISQISTRDVRIQYYKSLARKGFRDIVSALQTFSTLVSNDFLSEADVKEVIGVAMRKIEPYQRTTVAKCVLENFTVDLRDELFATVRAGQGTKDSLDMLELMHEYYDFEDKQSMVLNELSRWGVDGGLSALRWIEDNLNGEWRDQYLSEEAYSLFYFLPDERALPIIESIESEELRYTAAVEKARTWSQHEFDFLEYAEWLIDTVGEKNFQRALRDISSEWVKYDFEGAKLMAETVEDEETKHEYQYHVGRRMAYIDDPLLAVDYAVEVDLSKTRSAIVSEAIKFWAIADPEEAETFVMKVWQLGDPVRSKHSKTIAKKWGSMYPKQALEFFEQTDDYEVRRDALAVIVSEWVDKDPQAALSYLEETHDPGLRPSLVESVLSKYDFVTFNEDKAISLANAIVDVDKRDRILKRINNWLYE